MVASRTTGTITPQNNYTGGSNILVKCPRFDNGLILPFGARLSGKVPRIFTGNYQLDVLLKQTGSLTRALENRLQTRVLANIHQQTPHRLSTEWYPLIDAKRDSAWQVRTTSLYPQITHSLQSPSPVIFAQTLIPNTGLPRFGRSRQGLSAQPIGNVLFNQKQAPKRLWLFIGKVTRSRLPKSLGQLCDATNLSLNYKSLWVRQSILVVNSKPFAVTEIILPALLNALRNWSPPRYTSRNTPKNFCKKQQKRRSKVLL